MAADEPRKVCGAMFGREILLTGMAEGTGMRRCCLLFAGHEGEHSMENPELDLDWYRGELYA